MTEAYPLQWPKGQQKSLYQDGSRFKTTLNAAIRFVQDEIARLGGKDIVISSNRRVNLDGSMSKRATGWDDTAVAIYFTESKQQRVFACDRWNKLEDNIYAIGKTIEALRGIERWGSKTMARQGFAGFTALPPPEESFNWRKFFADHGFPEMPANEVFIQAAYSKLSKDLHPDRPTGDASKMADLNRARDEALKELA
jgi:hypothetical protein